MNGVSDLCNLPLRVVKLGGSLLESPDYNQRMISWLASLPPARTMILVGGGPPVDALRTLASSRSYDDVFMHWLCIDAMELSFRIAQHAFGQTWHGLTTTEDLDSWLTLSPSQTALVHVRAFYRADNYQSLPIELPLGWATTSDSLAALLACIVQADELFLVKSCLVPQPYDWLALSHAGVVDQAFPEAVKSIAATSIEMVTL